MRHQFGVAREPVANGQAEVAGMPPDLLAAMSSRTAQVDALRDVELAEFASVKVGTRRNRNARDHR